MGQNKWLVRLINDPIVIFSTKSIDTLILSAQAQSHKKLHLRRSQRTLVWARFLPTLIEKVQYAAMSNSFPKIPDSSVSPSRPLCISSNNKLSYFEQTSGLQQPTGFSSLSEGEHSLARVGAPLITAGPWTPRGKLWHEHHTSYKLSDGCWHWQKHNMAKKNWATWEYSQCVFINS